MCLFCYFGFRINERYTTKGIAEELLYIDKHIETFNYYCCVGGLEIDEDQSVLYVVQLLYCM